MAIELDTRRIRPSASNKGKTASNRAGAAAPHPRDIFLPPARAHVNFIPSPESLATLIQSAIAALRSGVFWDRGTILNLLV